MGQLIKLTVYKRGTILKSGAEMVFDTDSIISPIRLNAASKSYFTVKSKSATNLDGGMVDFQVEENLSEIRALASDLILLNVNTRHGNELTEEFLFNVKNMSEISTVPSGSSFLNIESGNPSLTEYVVDEDLDNIVTQANTVPSVPAQVANKIFAGPESGEDEIPSFRSLVTGDLPEEIFVDQSANKVYAGPETGVDAQPSFRLLTGDDIPLSIVEDLAAFDTINPDASLSIVKGGVTYYIPLLIYTP